MLNYIYDGTFEGLLTAIYEAYYRHEPPDRILPQRPMQIGLFDTNVSITTDTGKATSVYDAVRDKISPLSLENIYHVYLSELEESSTLIYNYLRLGFKMGSKVEQYLSNDVVFKIEDISRKVAFECHRMLGLLRFNQLNKDTYYAPMEPDFNIICLIAPHFASRLADQNWIIHDMKRKVAAIYNREDWAITILDNSLDFRIDSREADYQQLWRKYFHNIAIVNKINPTLQRKNMPARYWKYLIEKEPNKY